MTNAAPTPDLRLTLGDGRKGDPLVLANPVIAASGALGAGIDLAVVASIPRLGAFVTPAIGRGSRRRVGSPWIAERAAGLLLIGAYPTVSYRRALRDWAPAWRTWDVPVIANVPAADVDEAAETAEALAESDAFAALELDLTGLIDGDASLPTLAPVGRAIEAVQRSWPGVLIAKLPYAGAQTAALARVAARAGADAISLGGGLPTLAPPGADGDARPARLVGPATLPLVLPIVRAVAVAGGPPLIASGGIASTDDVLAFLRSGAAAVQVGSVALVDPRAPAAIADSLPVAIANAAGHADRPRWPGKAGRPPML